MPRQVTVTVKPGSRKGPLIQAAPDGSLVVYVREPATEGRANRAVTELLAHHFGVPKSSVELKGGRTGRTKRFQIG